MAHLLAAAAHHALGALVGALDVLQRNDILVVPMHGLSVFVLSRALVALLSVVTVVDVGVAVAGVGLAADEGVEAAVGFLVGLGCSHF